MLEVQNDINETSHIESKSATSHSNNRNCKVFLVLTGLSGVVLALLICAAIHRYLLQRNYFLERSHLDSTKQIHQLENKLQSLEMYEKEKESEENEVLQYRSEDALYTHVIELKKNTNQFSLQTTDNQTTQPVDETIQLPYQRLLDTIGNMRIVPGQLVLAESDRRYYALVKSGQGTLTLIYEISVDQYGDDPEIKLLSSELQNTKASYLCGYSIYLYFPETQKFVRDYGCGDGGGSGGEVQLVDRYGTVKTLQEYGGGMNIAHENSTVLLPRFFGSINGVLYFGELSRVEPTSRDVWISKIYSIDPLTGQKMYLNLDLSAEKFDIAYDENIEQPNEISLQTISNDGSEQIHHYLNVKTLQIRRQ
jgi:hypothetical protein